MLNNIKLFFVSGPLEIFRWKMSAGICLVDHPDPDGLQSLSVVLRNKKKCVRIMKQAEFG